MEVLCMDLDFTLVRYKVQPFVSMLYDVLGTRMVAKGYSELILDPLWKSRGLEFTQVGLVADVSRGIVIKLGPNCSVKRAYRGFCNISSDEVTQHYGSPPMFPVDPPAYHTKGVYWIFFTNFAVNQVALYSVIVELMNRDVIVGRSFSDLEQDLEDGINECFDNPGEPGVVDFYQQIYSSPGKFLQVEATLPYILRQMRNAGFKLVIVTNSYEAYTDFVCRYSLNEDWRSLFDDVITRAGKPGFFCKDDSAEPALCGLAKSCSFQSLKEKYRRGNFIFIGDHFIFDVYAAGEWGHAQTVAVVEEIESEFSEGKEFLPYWARFRGLIAEKAVEDLQDEDTDSKPFWFSFLESCQAEIVPSLKSYLIKKLDR